MDSEDEHKGYNPERTTLTREMWRDDDDPVAQTAKKYEIAMREARETHQSMPWHKRLGGYLLGGIVGILPGAIYYRTVPENKPSRQILAHTAMTTGTIIGLEVARELLNETHEDAEKSEAHAALSEARTQAKQSYAQSIAAQRAVAEQSTSEGRSIG